jgi:dTDP-4-dehydrorhamnose 3,5-epimerase
MTKRFDFTETPISGVYKISSKPLSDSRGFLSRIFCSDYYKELGFIKEVAQINHTLTINKGTVRGLHFQHQPHTETKVVTCIKGEVFDVAVDLRKNSLTFLHWHAEILSDSNNTSLYIPEGCAHGFQTLTDNCELIYIHSSAYNSEAEGAINILDPKFSIDWPLTITDISERDSEHAMIKPDFEGIDFNEM